MTKAMVWPTREEWTKRRRTGYLDDPDFPRTSVQASLYATGEEISGIVAALKAICRDHGKRTRELNRQGSPLYRQLGETEYAHYERVRDLRQADVAKATEPEALRSERSYIKKAITDLEADIIPGWYVGHCGAASIAIIEPLKQRREAAQQTAKRHGG